MSHVMDPIPIAPQHLCTLMPALENGKMHNIKGTAYSQSERKKLLLDGVLPYSVESLEVQLRRCYAQYQQCATPLQKHIYLKALNARNQVLFCRLALAHLTEMIPILYTPTIGQACLSYSLNFREPEGLHVTAEHRGKVLSVLDNWGLKNGGKEVAIIVVTDGSRILGLGDLGYNGMGIPVGKLFLYVLAGGFDPAVTLPVVIDVGTDNQQFLADEFYLGLRHKRLPDDTFYALVDEFMEAVRSKWPSAVVQFEDFSNVHCFDLLAKYKDRQLCFNDDIQGTGVVIASGFLNALRIVNTNISEMRLLFVGAGSAGVGVADEIAKSLQAKYRLPLDACRKLFYMIDSKGLITTSRSDASKLAAFKRPYARTDVDSSTVPADLVSMVRLIKPHALIGLSGVAGVFTDEVLRVMGELNARPIVFALSNPTDHAECSFQRAYEQTQGRVIFASGSPFPPLVTETGDTFTPSQGNNLYAFPGIGFGAWLCHAARISDEMLTAVSLTLANMVSDEELKKAANLYPPLTEIRAVTAEVAAAVIMKAKEQGLAQKTADDLPLDDKRALVEYIKKQQYDPQYPATNELSPEAKC